MAVSFLIGRSINSLLYLLKEISMESGSEKQ